jgi:thiol-disulfide isomerase/thioredoxin
MKHRTFLKSLIATAASFAGLTALSLADGWTVGTKLPSLANYGLAGKVPPTAGKVVYLDFWASWCAPCKASFPILDGWQKKFAARNFTVLGVNVNENVADMEAFLKKSPVGFPTVSDASQKLVAAANVSTMPTSILIDKKGVIRLIHSGFKAKDQAELEAQIEALLKE